MCLPLTKPCGDISLGGLAALVGAARNGFALAGLEAVRAATGLATGLPATACAATGFVPWAFLASGDAAVFGAGFVTALALLLAGASAGADLGLGATDCGLERAVVLTAGCDAVLVDAFVAMVMSCFLVWWARAGTSAARE